MREVKKCCAQGDMIIQQVETLPEGLKPEPEQDKYVAAHSETGHHHVALGADKFYIADAMTAYLVASGPVVMEHHRSFDTHEPIKLLNEGKGEVIWKISRQREYTPAGWRMVMD